MLATVVLVLLLASGCGDESEQATASAAAPSLAGAPSLAAAPSPQDMEHAPPHDVAAEVAPSLRVEINSDPVTGWNVHLITERFHFAPEQANREARPGEGHAHLYLDGKKIARVYGPWYHLRSDAVGVGEHILTVELSASDHGAWAIDNTPIALSTTITGTA